MASDLIGDLTIACDEFAATQKKFRKNGAYDTEPDRNILVFLVEFIETRKMRDNITFNEWELYDNRGSKVAAKELYDCYIKICKCIEQILEVKKPLPVLHYNILTVCHPLSLWRLDYFFD